MDIVILVGNKSKSLESNMPKKEEVVYSIPNGTVSYLLFMLWSVLYLFTSLNFLNYFFIFQEYIVNKYIHPYVIPKLRRCIGIKKAHEEIEQELNGKSDWPPLQTDESASKTSRNFYQREMFKTVSETNGIVPLVEFESAC